MQCSPVGRFRASPHCMSVQVRSRTAEVRDTGWMQPASGSPNCRLPGLGRVVWCDRRLMCAEGPGRFQSVFFQSQAVDAGAPVAKQARPVGRVSSTAVELPEMPGSRGTVLTLQGQEPPPPPPHIQDGNAHHRYDRLLCRRRLRPTRLRLAVSAITGSGLRTLKHAQLIDVSGREAKPTNPLESGDGRHIRLWTASLFQRRLSHRFRALLLVQQICKLY
ncbi:hypothetical protein B0T14DRAFT_250877 [Immersiella caudata]|uniref:Uncharacterized protein n=1 Tax=Immersiella caudata TaxID=314043 RepID=A0AA40BX19_9PEZI|nr:hypothetical protein B0T14DRAFT_250877 [Immersiella caudata]